MIKIKNEKFLIFLLMASFLPLQAMPSLRRNIPVFIRAITVSPCLSYLYNDYSIHKSDQNKLGISLPDWISSICKNRLKNMIFSNVDSLLIENFPNPEYLSHFSFIGMDKLGHIDIMVEGNILSKLSIAGRLIKVSMKISAAILTYKYIKWLSEKINKDKPANQQG